MAHINLLPWREGRRAEHKKNYLTLLTVLALSAIGLMFAAGSVLEKMTDNQNYRNNFIEQETALLDQQIEKIKNIKKDKEAIEQRMALIEQLESSRNAVPESTVFSSGELSSIKADTSALEAVSDFKLNFTINPSVAPDFSIINKEPNK